MANSKWVDAAENGNGHYAIALALTDVASALRALGVNNAATQMGAIEYLATKVADVAAAITIDVAMAIQDLKSEDD